MQHKIIHIIIFIIKTVIIVIDIVSFIVSMVEIMRLSADQILQRQMTGWVLRRRGRGRKSHDLDAPSHERAHSEYEYDVFSSILILSTAAAPMDSGGETAKPI